MRASEIGLWITLAEALPVKPRKPDGPKQWQQKLERRAKVQDKIQDENQRHADRVQDLRADLG
jgi:hypothetical protein